MNQSDLIAREAVRYTVSLYNSAVDRGAYRELANVFSEDAEMIISNEVRLTGREGIIDGLTAGAARRKVFEPGNFQRHLLGNSIINVLDHERARAVHYIMVTTELGLDHSGVYIDDLVRHGERWWIQRRNANMEWARTDSRFFTYPGKTHISTPDELDVGLFVPDV